MIDFSLRNLRILQEARDPETAVILIDVELGYGSNPDPAGQLVPVIQKAKGLAKEAGRHPTGRGFGGRDGGRLPGTREPGEGPDRTREC